MNWVDTKLGEICTLHYGKSLKGYQNNTPEDNPVQVFGTNGPIGWTKKPLTQGPTIVIGRKGAYRGVHIAKRSSWTIDTAYYSELDENRVCLPWMYYRLKLLDINSMNSGAAIPSTKREDFYSASIRVPDLPTQERIAGVLSAYDDLIENNRRRIALLEQAARLLYREWFVHFRFPGHETAKFIDGLPERWEARKVKDLITRLKSRPKVRKDEYQAYGQWPCVDQGQDFIGGYTDNREAVYHDGLPLIVFGDHTRALKFVDFPFARGADGTQIIQSNEERLPQELFYFSLINVDLSNYAYARHFKFLKEQVIIVPTVEMAKIFSDQAKAIFDQIRTFRGQNQKLAKARDLLLPRLMDGRLPIPE
ncbi:restriction endonuclease subunit S [Celeribacter halophilus]|uniref:restriction endonuclease subunit S n=1 Tax=Celeribacter halophilus TaxID=576117 RepID=UPI003A93AF31